MSPSQESSVAARRAALIVATLTGFLGPFLSSSVNVALPSIGADLGMGAVSLAWINTAFLLAASSLLLPFGRLGDLRGRRRIYAIGVVVLGTASTCIAFAGSGGAVIFWRVIQGAGTSMVVATALPILVSVTPPGERGAAIGINVAAVYLGLSTGPFLGGLLTEQWSWRAVFALYPPLAAFALVLVLTLLPPDKPTSEGDRFDLAGAALLGFALLASMFGISDLGTPFGVVSLVAGIAGLFAFVAWEDRAQAPVLDLDLFRRNTVFAFSSLAALILYASTFAVTFLMSLYLQRVQGFTPREAGLVLIAQPAIQAVLSPLTGRLSDRVQPRTVASAGMAITFAGLLTLTLLEPDSSLASVVARLAVLGVGFALFSSPNTNAIMSSVPPGAFGVAGAMAGTMRQLGMVLSMAVVMLLLGLHLGNAEITPANAGSFLAALRTCLLVFSGLCVVGFFASLARGRLEPTGTSVSETQQG